MQKISHFCIICPDLLTYLLTYLLTAWSRVLLEKLTGSNLVKKIPAFYGTRRFTTAFASARHLSLTWASSIQSMPSIPPLEDPSQYYSPIYAWVFQVTSFPQVAPLKLSTPLLSPIRATYLVHLILSDLTNQIIFGEEYRSLSSSSCSFLHSPVISFLLSPNILLNTLFSNTIRLLSSLNVSNQVSHPHKKKTGKFIGEHKTESTK